MQNIRPEEFNKLVYNVYALSKSRKVMDEWPELKSIPFYNPPNKYTVPKDPEETPKLIKPFEGLDPDKVLRFILIMWDRNSPLVQIQNTADRMKYAAEIAGFTNKNGELPTKVLKMFKGHNKDANMATIYWCRTQHSAKWTLFVALTVRLYADQLLLMQGDDDAPSSKVLIETAGSIDEMRSEILARLNNENLDESFEEFLLMDLGLRPEEISESIEDGKRVTNATPYK